MWNSEEERIWNSRLQVADPSFGSSPSCSVERLRLLLTTAGGIKRFAACIKLPRLLEAAMLQCCLGALDNCMRIEICFVSVFHIAT